MYKIYISDKEIDDEYHNLLEFKYKEKAQVANFIFEVLEHSENYTIEIIEEKGE